MRDSPDSFNRMRLKTGSATTRRSYGPPWLDVVVNGRLLADGEPHEALDDDVLARLGGEVGAQLLDGLAVVLVAVDVLLVQQDDVLVPGLELALDDLGPDVLRLVGGLLLVDARLGVLVLLRDLVL